MKKIKIIATPPGFAPEHIRVQWIGIQIPLTTPIPQDQVVAKIGNDNTDGYEVKGIDAVQALKDAKKNQAAEFWEPYSSGNFKFKKEVCELID